MTHPAWEALNRLVDDETDATETAALRAHLAACPSCASEIARLERLRAVAAAAPPIAAPPASWDAVRARIVAPPAPTPSRRSLARRAGPALAAAVAIVVAAVALRQATRAYRAPLPTTPQATRGAPAPLDAVTELEVSYRAVRARFTPEVRAAADAALADVERAIMEAAAAAEAGGADQIAAEMLRHGRAQKLDLLRRYTEMAVTL